MAKKLGRGLSHLLPAAGDTTSKTNLHPEYQEIPINEIHPAPDQVRKRFNNKEIESLAKTLHSVGLIEPIIVRKVKNNYQLVSGERRWRACKIAGFKKIPAIIKQLNDAQALEIGIIENIQREDLNPIEEARAYLSLTDLTGLKPSMLAEKVGKDRTTITNLIRLLKLPEEVIIFIENNKLTAGQARPLLSLGDKKVMHSIAKKIVAYGWTARRVEDEVSRLTDTRSRTKSSGSAGKKRDPNIKSLEEKIRKRIMAKVQIEHNKKGGGKLSINYGNLSDLDRILSILGIK